MASNDDDVFADDAEDDGGALAALRATLRARRDAWAGRAVADIRAEFDAGLAGAALPPGWNATPFDLGRPGEHLRGPSAALNRAILYLHGGGYCIGGLHSHRALAAQLGHAAQSEVFTLDYRRAPEWPLPAALDDALAAYERLIESSQAAQSIVLMGDSAGGGLAFSLAVRIRDEGLPGPLAIVAISPWTDLSLSGDSLRFKAEDDPALTRAVLEEMAQRYLGGADPRDPRASPLFADLAGLPPILIHVGGDEILLSDAERFVAAARAAGVDATVEIWPGLFHVWHAFFAAIEEGREGISEIGAWLRRRWKS
jgi:acetyl esterase/lipase